MSQARIPIEEECDYIRGLLGFMTHKAYKLSKKGLNKLKKRR